MQLEIDTDALENHVQQCFEYDMNLLHESFRESIVDDIWQWSDGGVRDIVDTGTFRDSQQLTVLGFIAEFIWDVEYASIIYFGLDDQNIYPARPWVKFTLMDRYNLEYFEKSTTWNSAEIPG